MVVCVEDSFSRVTLGETLSGGLAINVILGTAVLGEVRALVNESSSPGVSSGVGCLPEGTTEINVAIVIRVDVSISVGFSTSAVIGEATVRAGVQVGEVREGGGMVG